MQKPIKDFEGKYLISTEGEVFSLITNKHLKTGRCTVGYAMAKLFVSYCRLSNKRVYKYVRVHRLVAEHFLNNSAPEILTQVNHIDGNKVNNVVSNLEWVTPSQNMQHAVATGLFVKATALTTAQIAKAFQQYIGGTPLRVLMKEYGVSKRLLEWLEQYAKDSEMSTAFLARQKKNKHTACMATGQAISMSIVQKSLDGIFIKKWESMILAAKALNIGQGNISNVLAGRSKTCGGYLWEKA